MKTLLGSAAYRIAFASLLFFALVTLLLGSAVYHAAHAAFARQMDARIAQATKSIVAELGDGGVPGVLEAVRERETRGPDALGYAVFDAKGRHVGGQMQTERSEPGWRRIVFFDPREGPDAARAEVTELPGGYRLVVAADLEPLEEIDRTILMLFGIAFAVLLIVGVVYAFVLGTYLRRRLARMESTATAIMAGDLTRRTAISPRHDEFDRVAGSLNSMLDRIETLVVNLRQVTSDLAHDLRTPLAQLRTRLDLLRERSPDAESRRMAGEAVERTDDVLRLFDAILRIAELEEGGLGRHFVPVDLGALVEELGEIHAPIAEDQERVLVATSEPGCLVTGDRELIAQALINLIENALRHTPPGSRIWLCAKRIDGVPTAFVWDNGAGVAARDRDRIFDRFVRLEASRSTPGHGLGLSLVKAIAAAHRATIVVSDASPGLRVDVRFPPAEAA